MSRFCSHVCAFTRVAIKHFFKIEIRIVTFPENLIVNYGEVKRHFIPNSETKVAPPTEKNHSP